MVGDFMTNFVANYRMMRFLGNIESKLDAKGRVFFPATFRKILQTAGEDVLVLRKDIYQPCLVVYPLSVWDQRTGLLLKQVNEFDDESQMVLRMYMSEVLETALDSNGRLLIPQPFQLKAGINQTVRFIGINNIIEIWAAEKTEKPFLSQDEFATKLKAMMTKKEVTSDK